MIKLNKDKIDINLIYQGPKWRYSRTLNMDLIQFFSSFIFCDANFSIIRACSSGLSFGPWDGSPIMTQTLSLMTALGRGQS